MDYRHLSIFVPKQIAMAFGRKNNLRVEFYDQQDSKLIGYDELPLKAVPQSFKDETWVEIDEDRWKVTRVDPPSPKRAIKEGQLRVYVTLVERRSPQPEVQPVIAAKAPILYRVPTRADQLPRLSGQRGDLQLVEIAEWEWRGVEFMTASNLSSVKEVFQKVAELTALCTTVQDGRNFYTRQYERYDLHAPLRGTRLSLEQIITGFFPKARGVDGLTFSGQDKVADNTFVFRLDSGIAFYGQEFEEYVRYLGMIPPDELFPTALLADLEPIAALMRKKDLILVDWHRAMVVNPDTGLLGDYFRQVAGRISEEDTNVPAIPLVDFPSLDEVVTPSGPSDEVSQPKEEIPNSLDEAVAVPPTSLEEPNKNEPLGTGLEGATGNAPVEVESKLETILDHPQEAAESVDTEGMGKKEPD